MLRKGKVSSNDTFLIPVCFETRNNLSNHIYNRYFFEQYLLDNTILDKASTSRHEYMSLYEENVEMFIKLNLQVRFR